MCCGITISSIATPLTQTLSFVLVQARFGDSKFAIAHLKLSSSAYNMATATNANVATAAAVFGAAATAPKKAQEARIKLKNIDTVAAQSLNPYGVSVIDNAPLNKIYGAAAKGNKWAKFHAEVASDDPARQGIFWSRYAETNETIIKEMKG